jgi:antitoxin ParD1/3/4
MNLSIPDIWAPFIRSKVQSGRYGSENEVLEEALRLLEQRDATHVEQTSRLEELLIEGLDSGSSTPMTTEDWDAIEREGEQMIAARKARQT